MIIRVERGRVDLLEADELRELKIVPEEGLEAGFVAAALGAAQDPDDPTHVWVPAETVLGLAADRPDAWRESARAAFRAVEPFGWYDPAGDTIRIHIDT